MAQYDVDVTAIELDGGTGASVLIQNLGPGKLYIGDASVTAATGVEVAAGKALAVGRNHGFVYGVSDTTADVRVQLGGLWMS